MKKQTLWTIVGGGIVVLVIGIAAALMMQNNTDTASVQEAANVPTVENDNSASNINATINSSITNAEESTETNTAETEVEPKAIATTTTKGEYSDYNADKVAASSVEQTNILFFHAPWCPTCSALNKNIVANSGDIPNNVTIHKVDYDTNTALRKKYGVTYQHTLVQVDASGNQITKWSGGNTLASVIAKIK